MSNPRREAAACARTAGVRALTLALVCGTAACTASPRYPISLGERSGDGSVMAVQPRYAVSAQDAAQNAADRASQAGYPAYNAPPVGDPSVPPPAASSGNAVAEPPASQDNDMSDDAPRALHSAPVDSADLPPPDGAPAPPSAGPAPDAGQVPPPDPAATPHEIAYAFGGGRIVFGTDEAVAPEPELAAYRHHRHRRAADAAASDSAAPADASGDTDTQVPAKTGAADTPYQTVVRPGETLAAVAERVHSSKAALTELNALKHPRHVKAGTVLKIPYRYTYEVQKGDTLYTISHRFDQDPAALAKLNRLKAVPTLQPGQSLQLPPDASDQGKRAHAAADGPSPQAAPETLQTAALKKAERKGRRARAAEAAEAARAAERANRQERQLAASAPTARRHPSDTVANAETPSSTTAAVAAGGSMPAAILPTPSASRAPVIQTPSTAVASAAVGAPTATTPPAYPPTRAATPTGADAFATAAARPSMATPSTYVAPGYVARQTTAVGASGYTASRAPTSGSGLGTASGASATQYASAASPRYVPNFPAAGTAPLSPHALTLGRERPAAPALSGGALTAADIASAGRGRFVWPLRGQVIAGFGDRGGGEHNDGMDIAATPGTPVQAAAAGEVVYAGSSIPGFGNLVLVKHPGGWVTAYAHLDRIEVRMRDSVSQGEEIGQAGQSGVVDRPELHFEVRYAPTATEKARPVDPTLVLPAG